MATDYIKVYYLYLYVYIYMQSYACLATSYMFSYVFTASSFRVPQERKKVSISGLTETDGLPLSAKHALAT